MGEEDRDSAASRYFPKTASAENWGPSNQRKGRSYRKWKSGNDWEYVDGACKRQKAPKPDETATISGETRNLGFGEFADWT